MGGAFARYWEVSSSGKFDLFDSFCLFADVCLFKISEEPEEVVVPPCVRCRMPGPGVLSQNCVCDSFPSP